MGIDQGRRKVEESGRHPLHWPRLVIGLLAGILAGTLAVVLVNPHLGQEIEEASLQARSPAWLAVAVGAVIVFLLADAFSLAFLVRAHAHHLPLRNAVRVALESNLVAGATSFGGLEIPYQAMLLRRLGLSLPEITSSLLLKALVHISLLGFVAAGALLPALHAPFTPTQRVLILLVLAVLLATWAAGVFWLKRPWGLRRLPEPLSRRLGSFRETLRVFRSAGWRVFVPVLALQILYWIAMLSIIPAVLFGLGWRGGLMETVTRQAALQVLMPFSPLPGGAGVAEVGYLELIGSSLPGGIRVNSLLAWRVLTWLVPMVLGAVLLGIRGARSAEDVGAVISGRSGR